MKPWSGKVRSSMLRGACPAVSQSVEGRAWGSTMEAEQSFEVLTLSDYGHNIPKYGKEKIVKESLSLSEADFISTLDAKLKDLEEEEKRKKKNGKKRSVSLDNRPMFITTVKTGIFLEPPPELAALLGYNRSFNASSGSSQKSGEELMYSYSSQPRVLNNNRLKPKVSNERQQQINMEKQKNKNNTVRAKRDLGPNNNNINLSRSTNNASISSSNSNINSKK